jgi:hypothetical protein
MNRINLRAAGLAGYAVSALLAFLAAAAEPVAELDLRAIARQQPNAARWEDGGPGKGGWLVFTPGRSEETLELWNISRPLDWAAARYLVCEVWHTNRASAILNLDFHRRGAGRADAAIEQQGGQTTAGATQRPRISPKIGVLPDLKTQVIFPLSHLDAQEIFLARFPRQLKGTVTGSRLERDEIGALRLRVSPVQHPEHEGKLMIQRVYLTRDLPEPLPPESVPCVDEFGQWSRRDWPGKTTSEAALKQQMLDLERQAAVADYPANWSRFGGWKALRFEATGFFRTHHDGKRWWLVDPEGCAFLSAGMDCVGPNISTMVRGQEDLFQWLPDQSGPLGEAWSGRGTVDFLKANLLRVYGAEWRAKWEAVTSGLLKAARFNTVANWSDLKFARAARLPYVLPMRGFPRTSRLLYRDFPDVFSEEYEEAARRFARQLEEFKEDPFLIGYFLSNEPHWAFGKNNLAFEMFATAQSSATKREFVKWIAQRYDADLARFNTAWNLSLTGFADLEGRVFRDPPSATAEKDLWEFSGLMAERFVAVPCDAVKAVDPNHLNLGMRYAWVSSDLLYRAGQRFDVFSINGYSFPGPPETAEIARRSGKPVMIGEFHFGATDRGLPATGIQGVPDQAGRAKAYRYYVEQGFSRPEIVGLHYFQWFDQAITGRHDGENYNIGFLDICHRPYPELMEAARLTHEALYRVAAGELKPYAEKPAKAPAIYY